MTDTAELERLAATITPGPWHILNESDCHCDSDGNAISMAIGKSDYHAFALAMHPYSDTRVEANAQAIAIVPDLLAEVIALRAHIVNLRNTWTLGDLQASDFENDLHRKEGAE